MPTWGREKQGIAGCETDEEGGKRGKLKDENRQMKQEGGRERHQSGGLRAS